MSDDKDKDPFAEMFDLLYKVGQARHNEKELDKAMRFARTSAHANMVGFVFAIGCFIAFFMDSNVFSGAMLACWMVSVSFAEWYIRKVSVIMYEAHPAFVINPPPEGKNWKAMTAAVSSNCGLMGAMAGVLISGVLTSFAFTSIIGSALVWGVVFALQKYFRRRLERLTKALPRE